MHTVGNEMQLGTWPGSPGTKRPEEGHGLIRARSHSDPPLVDREEAAGCSTASDRVHNNLTTIHYAGKPLKF